MIHPFRVLTTSLVLTLFGVVSTARAYDPPPLCAYPTSPWPDFVGPIWYGPSQLPLALGLEPSGLMCSVDDRAAGTPGAEEEVTVEAARTALNRARRLADRGRFTDAVLQVRLAAAALPVIADRLALLEGEYRMRAGPDEAACDAFARAMESPERTVALRGRLARVRCLLMTDHRDGPQELTDLERRYPDLAQRDALELELAAYRDRAGDREEAGQIYRRIDLMSPGSPVAAVARERITALVADGVDIRALTTLQEVDRAQRLVSTGPMDEAREEVERLRAQELPNALRQQLAASAARIARVEGRWADASELLREARGLPQLDEGERAAMEERIEDLSRAAEPEAADDVARRIRGITRGRPIGSLATAPLFSVLRVAARARDTETVNATLTAIRGRDRIPPGLRFDAAILAAGTGDDALVEALFASAVRHPGVGVAARYHRARALERMGRRDEAAREYAQVVADDSQVLPYYSMWSRQRLRVIAPRRRTTETRIPVAELVPTAAENAALASFAKSGEAAEPESLAGGSAPPTNPFAQDDAASSPDSGAATASFDLEAGIAGSEREGTPDTRMTPEQIIGVLEPIAEEHGDAYPFIERAITLVRLGRTAEAADELHETLLTWREATGQGTLRSGLEGVLRGATPPRPRVAIATWRARRRLDPRSRIALARAAAALGDPGLAIRLSRTFDVTGARPRAFEDIVTAAARRHGVEPELLFAVMRVESVYNPRIISYAGAIGLMQIMPRTGRLIASSLHRDDFTVDQLLEPEVNIEFAAWYLSSLIERFDGRLPLAIASYNGGPHNVRRWMRDYSPDMPVDAFLERIPFDQTHRYVRRVLTHYEAYRTAQHELPQTLALSLPGETTDTIAF
ncbi:MAG: transglycosylase SLT domain-containing protein [Sandaracinaceae bacterium]